MTDKEMEKMVLGEEGAPEDYKYQYSKGPKGDKSVTVGILMLLPALVGIILMLCGIGLFQTKKTSTISGGGWDRWSESSILGGSNFYNDSVIKITTVFIIVMVIATLIFFLIGCKKQSTPGYYVCAICSALSILMYFVMIILSTSFSTTGSSGGGITAGTSTSSGLTGMGFFILLLIATTAIYFIVKAVKIYKEQKN